MASKQAPALKHPPPWSSLTSQTVILAKRRTDRQTGRQADRVTCTLACAEKFYPPLTSPCLTPADRGGGENCQAASPGTGPPRGGSTARRAPCATSSAAASPRRGAAAARRPTPRRRRNRRWAAAGGCAPTRRPTARPWGVGSAWRWRWTCAAAAEGWA